MIRVVTFLLCISSLTAVAQQPYVIPKPLGLVSDYENIFTGTQETKLTRLVARYEKKTTVQIAVATIDTSMVIQPQFDGYTLAVANNWGVGQKERNNGVVIALSKGYRQIRIQNGLGIEKYLTDERTKFIIDNDMIPHYKRGNYYKGTRRGLKALMKQITR